MKNHRYKKVGGKKNGEEMYPADRLSRMPLSF